MNRHFETPHVMRKTLVLMVLGGAVFAFALSASAIGGGTATSKRFTLARYGN